ncbi:hypothetical protein CSAL01_00388 [Colletotrichum salicis]|uniref:Uncharacterized protein n=1 Tax=Colletotrichum salicis TaxID=1209931 RepID=A0A135SG90_9PEZI|nr:hypothetical protein CSAL01_00388 [Colletotrichum salicis]
MPPSLLIFSRANSPTLYFNMCNFEEYGFMCSYSKVLPLTLCHFVRGNGLPCHGVSVLRTYWHQSVDCDDCIIKAVGKDYLHYFNKHNTHIDHPWCLRAQRVVSLATALKTRDELLRDGHDEVAKIAATRAQRTQETIDDLARETTPTSETPESAVAIDKNQKDFRVSGEMALAAGNCIYQYRLCIGSETRGPAAYI